MLLCLTGSFTNLVKLSRFPFGSRAGSQIRSTTRLQSIWRTNFTPFVSCVSVLVSESEAIKVNEHTIENMMRRSKLFEPPRFMTVNQALEQLEKCEERNQQRGNRRELTPLCTKQSCPRL